QAEDGIRDFHVTGVQTCALPISVLPTPVGPRKMKLPTGRFGFFNPARDRRMAREIAEIAFSWLTTRRWRSLSIRSSLSPSSWLIDEIGTPVHFDTTSSISDLPTMIDRKSTR